MKTFHCDVCDNLVYFENVRCSSCGHELGYAPSLGSMTAIVLMQDGSWQQAGTRSRADAASFRKCHNYAAENVCNWMVDAGDHEALCASCRLTGTIPNLSVDGSREAWFKLAAASRRLIYSLLAMGLPVERKTEPAPLHGLLFRFMADDPASGSPDGKVMTGHDDGVIVINVAEADDAERERRRVQMHEPYRTLLGHFRHEIGHYYWDVLIQNSDRLEAFRQLFGDERADYEETLKHYYETGAPADWQDRFVSAYATSHPWEDWAETWAHYMHLTDALEIADASGLALRPARQNEPQLQADVPPPNPASRQFKEMIDRWLPVTYLINSLNRGLGLADAYPFVLSVPALEKLRFVHDTIYPQHELSSDPLPVPDPADQNIAGNCNMPQVDDRNGQGL